MWRRALLALLLAGLLGCALPDESNQDFNLLDALDDNDQKPTPKPAKKPSSPGNELSLEDALAGPGDPDPASSNPSKPKPHPNPKQPGTSGGFSDSDLADGISDGGGGARDPGNHRREGDGDGETQADSPGMISGIIGAVVVAVAGAVSSFVAYQKKKWCFKENDGGKI